MNDLEASEHQKTCKLCSFMQFIDFLIHKCTFLQYSNQTVEIIFRSDLLFH